MTPQALAPALIAPLLGFAIYRRVRRNIGRQPLRPIQLKVRIVMLTIATLFIAIGLARTADMQLAIALGSLPGIALAIWGVRLTRFESSAEGRFYTPNPYLGFAVSALLVARVAYRIVQTWPAMQSAKAGALSTASMYTPSTMALLGLVVGYYIAYCAGLLWRTRAATTTA